MEMINCNQSCKVSEITGIIKKSSKPLLQCVQKEEKYSCQQVVLPISNFYSDFWHNSIVSLRLELQSLEKDRKTPNQNTLTSVKITQETQGFWLGTCNTSALILAGVYHCSPLKHHRSSIIQFFCPSLMQPGGLVHEAAERILQRLTGEQKQALWEICCGN